MSGAINQAGKPPMPRIPQPATARKMKTTKDGTEDDAMRIRTKVELHWNEIDKLRCEVFTNHRRFFEKLEP
jgi:hypothetical protein